MDREIGGTYLVGFYLRLKKDRIMSPEEVETLTYKSVRMFRAWAEVICYPAACSFPNSQLWVVVDSLVGKCWNLQGWFGAGKSVFVSLVTLSPADITAAPGLRVLAITLNSLYMASSFSIPLIWFG